MDDNIIVGDCVLSGFNSNKHKNLVEATKRGGKIQMVSGIRRREHERGCMVGTRGTNGIPLSSSSICAVVADGVDEEITL